MLIWIKFTHSSSLISKMLMFILAIFCLTTFQFTLIHGPNIPGSYAVLLFTALDLASITSLIHNWVLFLLWLHRFILSGVISPLISSSILGTYWPGGFLFQYPIILPFHTVHGVLKARILKWFAIPSSSGPHSVNDWLIFKRKKKEMNQFRNLRYCKVEKMNISRFST